MREGLKKLLQKRAHPHHQIIICVFCSLPLKMILFQFLKAVKKRDFFPLSLPQDEMMKTVLCCH